MRVAFLAGVVLVGACTGSLTAEDGGAPCAPGEACGNDAGSDRTAPPSPPNEPAVDAAKPDAKTDASPADGGSPDATTDSGPADSGTADAKEAGPPSTECGTNIPFEIPIDPTVCTTLAVGDAQTRIARLQIGQSRTLVTLGPEVVLPGAASVFSLGLHDGFMYTCTGVVVRIALADGAVEPTDLACEVVTADASAIWVQSAARNALERYPDYAALVAHTPSATYPLLASARLASRDSLFAYGDAKYAWRIDLPTQATSVSRLVIPPVTPIDVNGLAIAPSSQMFFVSSQRAGDANGLFTFGSVSEPGFNSVNHLTICPAFAMHGLSCN